VDRVFLSPKLGLPKRLFQNLCITATTVQFNYYAGTIQNLAMRAGGTELLEVLEGD